MTTVGVNGRFYAAPVTGVQRFAREITRTLCQSERVTLLVPRGAAVPRDVETRATVLHGGLRGHAWEQVELPGRALAAGCGVVLHPANAAPSWGGPHVLVVHDVTPLTNPEWFTRRFAAWYRFVLTRAAARATRLLVPSSWVREQCARALRVPEERMTVITQGVDPFDEPATSDAVQELRTRWRLPRSYLLAVGRGDPRKNIAFLYDVLAQWPDRHDFPTLVVVGDRMPWVHRDPPPPVAAGFDIRCVGRVADGELHALYTGASAFCFPSLAEGFGRPPLEAMACGTPAVVADYYAAREILGNGACILPLDANCWAETLARISTAEAERARWSALGRARAALFSWQRAGEQVIAACHQAAG